MRTRNLGAALTCTLAITVCVLTALPAQADVGNDPLTASEVAGALDGAGARVSASAPATIDGDAAVSDANGTEVTVPRDPSEPVQVGSDPGSGLEIGVPGGDENADSVIKDGVSIFRNTSNNTATAVNPLEGGGAQFLTTIGDAGSPTRYAYPVSVPDGAALQLTEDGGAEVRLPDGSLAASISTPWAVDASRKSIPTHFEINGSSLVQVVDHRSEGVSYPVVADPKVFTCDFYTHTCIKTTKAETKLMAQHLNLGMGVGATVCIAVSFAGGIPGAVCGAVLALGGGALADSISNAAARGKCIELHFLRNPWVLTHWKTESC